MYSVRPRINREPRPYRRNLEAEAAKRLFLDSFSQMEELENQGIESIADELTAILVM